MNLPSDDASDDEPRAPSSWQLDSELMRMRSEQRAWYVARVSLLLTGLALFALAALTPLKSAVPYVVYVDKVTGEAEVVDVLDRRTASGNAVQDKHWVTQYVRARERYLPELLQFDYDSVMAQSDQGVAHMYAQIYEGNDALNRRLGDHTQMLIDVLSVTLPPAEAGRAVVRFERVTRRDSDQSEIARTRFVATLAFQYRPPQFVREQELVENPLGFRVTAYTVDAELIQGSRPDGAHPSANRVGGS